MDVAGNQLLQQSGQVITTVDKGGGRSQGLGVEQIQVETLLASSQVSNLLAMLLTRGMRIPIDWSAAGVNGKCE